MQRASLVVSACALLAACSSGPGGSEGTIPFVTAPTATEGAATERAQESLKIRLEAVVSGLAAPTAMASTPSEPNRLYVVEQPGSVRVVENGELLPDPFLDLRSEVRSGGEQGLLSLAFDPDYESNRLFYVDFTDTNGDTRVVEYEAGGAVPVRRRELLFVDQPYANHNGGQLAFGPDGRLYVGMGDGGSGSDPENRAQDLSQRLGKLLSIDVDEPGADWRIEGYGLRNPWRFSFDRETGDLWIGDVGQGEWEEIDHTPRESPGLENYGWDAFEGTHVYEDKDPTPVGHLVTPVYEYSHDEGCSVTGGYVYRGDDIPAARGRYFFADYCSDRMWSLVLGRGHARDVRRDAIPVSSVSSFGEDAHGELYVLSLEGDVVKLVPG